MPLHTWKNVLAHLPLLWRLTQGSPSPVPWVGLGYLTLFLARLRPPKQPPILKLSLPRSGSSWVGHILGSSPNALYLREPVTQSAILGGQTRKAVFHVDKDRPDPALQQYADSAFQGIPDFSPGILAIPTQWDLQTRTKKRVVIKEVNPLATRLFLSASAPQVIVLVRHPAAVALSHKRLGWRIPHLTEVYASLRALENINTKRTPFLAGGADFWTDRGLMQGGCLYYVHRILDGYENCIFVRYEDLCEDPLSIFRSLFDFSGLKWSSQSKHLIEAKSPGDDRKGPYSLSPNSRSMPHLWKNKVSADQATRLRAGFSYFDLPWYASEDDSAV